MQCSELDDDGTVLAKVLRGVLARSATSRPGVIELVRVWKKSVGLAGELDAETGEGVFGTDGEDLHLDGLPRRDLLRLLHALRRAKLEGHFALEEDRRPCARLGSGSSSPAASIGLCGDEAPLLGDLL